MTFKQFGFSFGDFTASSFTECNDYTELDCENERAATSENFQNKISLNDDLKVNFGGLSL